jgi:hypothetical protein
MKKPYLLDPKRANDPDVVAAYEADLEQFRTHANYSELDRLVQKANEIERDLESARSRKQRARIRVLTSKLRGANAAIKTWLAGHSV